MQAKLLKFDAIAGIESEKKTVRNLERLAFLFLLLTAFSAPHSIAATQAAWLTGMVFWVARLALKPRIKFRFDLLDIAFCALFLWTSVSAVFSYDQPTSIDKLRSAAVFLLFYFAFYNIRNRRAAALVACVLVGSCMINVLWVPVERLIGRGVEIHSLSEDGAFAKAGLKNGDTLLTAGGEKLRTPEQLLTIIGQADETPVKYYRPDYEFTVRVKRADLLQGETANERFGFGSWKKSNNWRSSGFYGHYATYAEVLQLIGSLAFGLLIAAFVSWRRREVKTFKVVLISGCFALMAFALLLTVTRAPQLGLMISAGVIVFVGLGRKWMLVAALVGLPVALGGLYFLQQSRDVGFFDRNDESTRYRKVMMQDGLRLMTDSPRNFIFGIGVDSIKKNWREWGMFEGGNLPMGHFHSTPLQLAVERGVPALLIWLVLMGAYLRSLWRGLAEREYGDWPTHGILLGSLGGTIGFLASSIVHYNFGDQEVVMTFYLLMGISLAIISRSPADEAVMQRTRKAPV